MKRTVKIALLLGAVVVAGGVSVWRWGPSRGSREPAAATPPTSRPNVPPPAAALAPAADGPVSTAPHSVPESGPSVRAASATVFAKRVKAVRALPAALNSGEIHAFHGYLLAPSSSGALNRQQENWLRNEMMDKLAKAPAPPAGLAGVLVAIYQDPAQDIVMRDYAVQHMTPVYARANAEEQAALRQTLWQAVEETDSSIAGTALLALRALAQDHPEIEPDKLGQAALKLAGDDRCGELSRITALQVCGRMGLGQAAPILRQLAQADGSVPLQITAIAALGDVGNQAARDYLRQLAVQPEPRLRPALTTALKKMDERLGM